MTKMGRHKIKGLHENGKRPGGATEVAQVRTDGDKRRMGGHNSSWLLGVEPRASGRLGKYSTRPGNTLL